MQADLCHPQSAQPLSFRLSSSDGLTLHKKSSLASKPGRAVIRQAVRVGSPAETPAPRCAEQAFPHLVSTIVTAKKTIAPPKKNANLALSQCFSRGEPNKMKIPLMSANIGKPVLKSMFAGALLLGSASLKVPTVHAAGSCGSSGLGCSLACNSLGINYVCIGCSATTYYCQSEDIFGG